MPSHLSTPTLRTALTIYKDVTRRAAILLMCGMTFYYVRLYRSLNVNIREEHVISNDVGDEIYSPDVSNSSDGYHRVLFFSYIRGGSSIGSEIFDVDNRSIFWYEPLDPFYFSMTGYFGRKCQKVYLDEEESILRPLHEWEVTRMTGFMQNLYDCRLTALPIEIKVHRFLMHTSAFKSYSSCYEHNSADSIIWDLIYCRRMLQEVCGMSVETAIKNQCPDVMDAVHLATNINVTSQSKASNFQLTEVEQEAIIRSHLNTSGYDLRHSGSHMTDIYRYRSCLDDLEEISTQCLPFAQQVCPERKIRAAKVVRATLQPVAKFLESIPGLKVIVFVRDPRAVAVSRSSKTKPKNQVLRNFLKLCMKMRADIYYKQEIEKLFPQSIIVVRYEDFVVDPVQWISKMYRHIGTDLPTQTTSFVKTHLYAGEDDGLKFGDVRANASHHVDRWRKYVADDLMFKMQQACPDVLQTLKYPFY